MLNIVQDSALLESIGAQTETVSHNYCPIALVFFGLVLRRQYQCRARGA